MISTDPRPRPFMTEFPDCPDRLQAWDLLAVCNGVLCGFVAVTAGCHVLEPWAAIIDGIVADIVFELVCMLWLKLKIDDPLSAAPMHGFAGMTGLVMVGFLAKREYIYQVGVDCDVLWP